MSFNLVKPAYAQSLTDIYAPGKAIGTNITLGQLLSPLIQNLTIVAGVFSLFVIVIGGLHYISSSGDSGKMESAQKMITYAIIGLVLSVAAFWIARILITVLGGQF